MTDTTPPTVTIDGPADGATVQVGSRVYVAVTATDDSRYSMVKVTINGKHLFETLSDGGQISWPWDVPKKPGVAYVIEATAHDGSVGDPSVGIQFVEPWNVSQPVSATVKSVR